MSKPTNIDAQRVLAIMDELKEKLTYLSVVTSGVLEGLNSEDGAATADMLGPELMKRFHEQTRLEDIYDVSIKKADGALALAMDNEDLRETLDRLQKNTRELCRKMKDKPNIVAELRNFQEQRPQNVVQLLRTLADMQDVTLKRLTTTVEEEKSRQELLQQYKDRRDAADTKRKQLEINLAHIRREREKAQSARTEVITKLRADLLDVKESTDSRLAQLKSNYEEEMEKHRARHREVTEAYMKKLEEMKGQYADIRKDHRDTEEVLRKKKVRAEDEHNRVIQDYDTRIEDMMNDYESNVNDFDKERKQLLELEEHFAKVDAEKRRQQQEAQIEHARQTKRDEEERRLNDMATLVQAYWKAINVREQFVKERKAMKKKGGKKGGKKK